MTGFARVVSLAAAALLLVAGCATSPGSAASGAGTPAVAVPHQGESQTAGSYPDQDLRMVAIEAVRVKGACSHGTAVPSRAPWTKG